MHQAVEMKEGVPVTKATEHAAEITYQSYYRMYKKLAGMTGTAAQNWLELYRVYKLWVVCVPTNKPCIRQQWPDRVYPTEDRRGRATAGECTACWSARRRPRACRRGRVRASSAPPCRSCRPASCTSGSNFGT